MVTLRVLILFQSVARGVNCWITMNTIAGSDEDELDLNDTDIINHMIINDEDLGTDFVEYRLGYDGHVIKYSVIHVFLS